MARVAKKKEDTKVETLDFKARVYKMVISNFRGIGNNPVEIDLDDIVVLIGPNNVGKTSILKAYELIMSEGSNKAVLTIEDFPNKMVDEEKYPEIELQTVVLENSPGETWIETLETGESIVRERWIWKVPGPPKRQGYDVVKKDWSDSVPWGAPNVANSRRPEPHMISAFDSPDEQAIKIQDLLSKALQEKIDSLKNAEEDNEYKQLIENITKFQMKILKDSKTVIEEMETSISKDIEKVFPQYAVKLTVNPDMIGDKDIKFFTTKPQLTMGQKEGFFSDISRQGSGARRTLLWTALKYISEDNRKSASKSTERPHVLLLDEPEICLHPNAIREACKVLYDLPQNTNWQVMVTTHSPLFIDVSRDNTTIIRVERQENGEIQGTTIFRPSRAKLGEDDKENLKLLNICDPYISEFFFGSKNVIVEGDTEYTAFRYIISNNPCKYKGVHIIRARGKATIASVAKILNQFGADYSILHDSDRPKIEKNVKGTLKETVNPAWTNNRKIMDAVDEKPETIKVRVLASIPNFEGAYLDKEVSKEKPYNALSHIKDNPDKIELMEKVLDALLNHANDVPEGCKEWQSIDELESAVEK